MTPVRRGPKRKQFEKGPRRRLIKEQIDENENLDNSRAKLPRLSKDEESQEQSTSSNGNTSSSRYNLRRQQSLRSPEGVLILQTILTPYRSRLPPSFTPSQTPFYKPFKTPRIQSNILEHSINKAKTKVAPVLREKWNEEVEALLHKTWKTCYLSSLSNFRYSSKVIKKKYEKMLKEKISEVYPSLDLNVKLETSCLLTQNPKVVDAVVFRVRMLQPLTEDEEGNKLVRLFDAWLFKTEINQCRKSAGAEWFPLMIYTGPEVVYHAFIGWLQSSFGCYITPRGFSQSTVLWVAGVWAKVTCKFDGHAGTDDKDSDMLLKYIVRPFSGVSQRGKTSVKLTFLKSDILAVCSRLETNDEDLSQATMSSFHSLMAAFVERLTHLPRELLCLTRMSSTCAQIAVDGKIRLCCPLRFPSFLNHLMEIFLSGCHSKDHNFDGSEDDDDDPEDDD